MISAYVNHYYHIYGEFYKGKMDLCTKTCPILHETEQFLYFYFLNVLLKNIGTKINSKIPRTLMSWCSWLFIPQFGNRRSHLPFYIMFFGGGACNKSDKAHRLSTALLWFRSGVPGAVFVSLLAFVCERWCGPNGSGDRYLGPVPRLVPNTEPSELTLETNTDTGIIVT